MRVAISDYDGTLKREGEVSQADQDAIAKWVKMGNKFGIATGRDLGMTLFETEQYGIPFDFLVCMNGNALHDHDCSLLQGSQIDDSVVPLLVNHPAAIASLHLAMMGDDLLSLFFRGRESWFLRLPLPYREISFDQAENMKTVRQISLGYGGHEEAAEWARQLNMDFAGRIIAHGNANTIDINLANTDKAQGIKSLLALKNWQAKDLLVIGDGGNDLGMVKAFGGYTLPHGSDELKKLAKGVVGSLAELLNTV